MEYLRSLSASQIDEEMHEMEYLPTPYAEGSFEEGPVDLPEAVQNIMTVLEFIEFQMDARTDFEFVQVGLPLLHTLAEVNISWCLLAM